jgi:hypothetical protein
MTFHFHATDVAPVTTWTIYQGSNKRKRFHRKCMVTSDSYKPTTARQTLLRLQPLSYAGTAGPSLLASNRCGDLPTKTCFPSSCFAKKVKLEEHNNPYQVKPGNKWIPAVLCFQRTERYCIKLPHTCPECPLITFWTEHTKTDGWIASWIHNYVAYWTDYRLNFLLRSGDC